MNDTGFPNVFWRTFNPHVSGKTGAPLSSPRWSYEWWAHFEGLLGTVLVKHAATIIKQSENIREGDAVTATDLAVYAHRTIRDIRSRTAYSYPRVALARRRLFYMLMHLPGWFHFDMRGWGVDNSALDTPFQKGLINQEESRRFVANLRGRLLLQNLSKHVQPPPQKLDAVDYVLHCVQMPKDYTITHHSPMTVEEALETLCVWASRRRLPVVVKPHPVGTPKSVGRLLERWGNSSYVRIYRGNIHSAIQGARLVVVINSGTGFEALVHGKPVATLGACDYKAATFVASRSTLDDAWEWSQGHDQSIQERFILWYYRTLVFDVENPTCRDRVEERICEVLHG